VTVWAALPSTPTFTVTASTGACSGRPSATDTRPPGASSRIAASGPIQRQSGWRMLGSKA